MDCSMSETYNEEQVATIAIEYAPNGELFDMIKRHKNLPEPIVRRYTRQLLSAIHYMNTQGIAHRDLKCENILVDAQYNLKVADLGLSCQFDKDNSKGFSSSIVGTPSYMVPELKLSGAYQPYMCDLFSLGIMIFIMYTGHAPFAKADLEDPHFILIARNQYKTFWDQHKSTHKDKFFSTDFINLITLMLSMQPFQRIEIADIFAHPFVNEGLVAT